MFVISRFKHTLPTLAGALALTAAVMGNELAHNLWLIYQKVGSSKVMSGVSSEVNQAVRDLAPSVAWMVLLTAAVTFALALGWVAISRTAGRVYMGRWGDRRFAKPIFWFFNLVAFFNLLYGIHDLLFPHTETAQSPLAVAFGLIDPARPWLSSGLWLLALSLPVGAATLWTALRASRGMRIGLAGSLTGLITLFGGYDLLTNPAAPTQFNREGNVILIGVDSLQYNRLPVGGSPENLSPNVNAFFEESYQFANAWTPFARTGPSWLSILTGREPIHHGMRYNLMPDQRLDPGNRYLANRLREKDYYAFHANDGVRFCNIRPIHGYQRLLNPRMGIEDFFVGNFFDFSVANLLRQTALGHDLFPAIANNNAVAAYNPRLFTRSLKRELNRLPQDRPLFITMHLSANHWPFKTPSAWCYGSDNMVENCIRMVDDQVGNVLGYLRDSGLWERSTVFVLSDHGDGWTGDPAQRHTTHGEHFDLPWSNRIILAMHRPGERPARTQQLVRTMDIYPTVLELAGCPAPEEADAIDGRSLLPIVRGEATDPRSLFAETGLARNSLKASDLARKNIHMYTYDHATGLVSLREEAWRGLLPSKYYMLIEGNWRLWVRPRAAEFAVLAFDRQTGLDASATGDCPEAVKRGMIARLADHFGMQGSDWLAMGRQSGFLPHGDPPEMVSGHPADSPL